MDPEEDFLRARTSRQLTLARLVQYLHIAEPDLNITAADMLQVRNEF